MDGGLAAGQRHTLHPAFAEPGHQDVLHLRQGHRRPAPCRRDKAVDATEIAPLVNLNKGFAVGLLYRGPEVAGCRLFASADRFGVHRLSLTSSGQRASRIAEHPCRFTYDSHAGLRGRRRAVRHRSPRRAVSIAWVPLRLSLSSDVADLQLGWRES